MTIATRPAPPSATKLRTRQPLGASAASTGSTSPRVTSTSSHCGTLRHTVRFPMVDDERAGEPGGVAPDHAGSQQVALQGLAEVEEMSETRVLQLGLVEPHDLLLEVPHPVAQRLVLLAAVHQVAETVPRAAHGAGHRGACALERRHHLQEEPPERVATTARGAHPERAHPGERAQA